MKEIGLVAEHSYGIIDAFYVKDEQGNKYELLKMFNPWGFFEWKGNWGSNSD